jgi:hypothetical protein
LPSTAKQSKPQPPQLVGKGFQKGQSGNPNGRPKDRLRPALRALLTDDDIKAMMVQAIRDTVHADPEVRAKARAWIVEQCDGKLIDRRESGEPGDFDNIASVSDDDLKKILKMVS